MADLIFTVDAKDVAKLKKDITSLGPTATKAASTLDSAFKKAMTSVKKEVTASQRLQAQYSKEFNSRMAFSKRMEAQKAKETAAAERDARRVADAEERLKNKYVQGYTAMSIYSKELNDLATARKMDIISADQQKAAVEELNMQMAAGTGVFANYANAGGRSNRVMGRSSVITQQAGYQIGDFLVQVQSGTNAMVAFGQQATQVAGTLTILDGKWVGIGTALGIGIPLVTAIGAAFMRTRAKASESADSVDDVESALKSLSDAYKETEASAASFQGVVEDFNARQVANGYVVLAERVGETFGASLMDRAVMALRGYGPDSNEMKVVEENLQKAFGVFGRTSADIFGAGFVGTLEQAIKTEDVAALEEIINNLDAFGNRNPVGDQFIQDLIEAVNLMKGYNDEVVKAADKLQEAVDLGEDIRDLDIKLGVEAAASAATLLAERLGISLGAAQRMVGLAQGQGVSGPEGAVRQMQDKFTNGLRTGSIVFQGTYNTGATGGGPTGGGAGGGGATQADPLKQLQDRIALEEELVGKTEAQRQVIQALGIDWRDYNTNTVNGIIATIEELDAMNKKVAEQQSIADTIESSMSDSFMSIVEGTKTVGDAFKNMARLIIKQLFDVLVIQQIVGSFNMATGVGSGIVGSIMGGITGGAAPVAQANGGAWNKGVQMFANGGVVNGATMFSHSGGLGVMGEAGPEAIMPLKRGANGKLGVQMEGGSSQPVVINQNFNFSANGDESVKRIIASEAPKIANLTQKQIMDQRRRGGSMKSTFG